VNVDPPGVVLAGDLVRGGLDVMSATSASRTRRVAAIRTPRMSFTLLRADGWSTREVRDLAAFVDVGDFDALIRTFHHPADVARLDPVARGASSFVLTTICGTPTAARHASRSDGYVLRAPSLLRRFTAGPGLGPENAHDDRRPLHSALLILLR